MPSEYTAASKNLIDNSQKNNSKGYKNALKWDIRNYTHHKLF